MSNLRQTRIAAGLTQQQLAERAGVRKATITDIETGKSQGQIRTIVALAEALKCKPADLIN